MKISQGKDLSALGRALFKIIRSRNFLALAMITALPEVFVAVSSTYKLFPPATTGVLFWLLRMVVALSWVYGFLKAFESYADDCSRKP